MGKYQNKKQGSKQDIDAIEVDVNARRNYPFIVKEYSSKSLPRMSDMTSQFKKDWAKLEGSGRYKMHLLKTVMMHLVSNEGPLQEEYRDHPLSGEWLDYRDCHITGDWVLIYKVTDKDVIFARTGTHSELFG